MKVTLEQALTMLDAEEGESLDDALARVNAEMAPPPDQRICKCGHGMTRHRSYMGRTLCKPSSLQCGCAQPHPVARVSDTRSFLRQTAGAGPLHALSRGISMLLKKGGDVEWLPVTGPGDGIMPEGCTGPVCEICQNITGELVETGVVPCPVEVSEGGIMPISREITADQVKVTMFLCPEHRREGWRAAPGLRVVEDMVEDTDGSVNA